MIEICPVLMVGGAGTRLWPVSRQSKPKQFQKLVTGLTMFQETVLRVSGTHDQIEFSAPIIIGAAKYRELIEAQLAEINIVPQAIILEPCARNTAPVAAIAADVVQDYSENAQVLLLPSDHHIEDPETFQQAVSAASSSAASGSIVTFGISPTGPETGFGYIEAGQSQDKDVNRIAAFVEKPDAATAQKYCDAGNYFWNAGIFLYTPARMKQEFETHAADILTASLEAHAAARIEGPCRYLDNTAFEACRSDSIDYAVMEKTAHAAVFGPLSCGWNDIGSWNALAARKDTTDTNKIISVGTENCYIKTDDNTLVAAVGVKDLIIVAHEGAVLIMRPDQAQNVKQVIAELKSRGQDDRL